MFSKSLLGEHVSLHIFSVSLPLAFNLAKLKYFFLVSSYLKLCVDIWNVLGIDNVRLIKVYAKLSGECIRQTGSILYRLAWIITTTERNFHGDVSFRCPGFLRLIDLYSCLFLLVIYFFFPKWSIQREQFYLQKPEAKTILPFRYHINDIYIYIYIYIYRWLGKGMYHYMYIYTSLYIYHCMCI